MTKMVRMRVLFCPSCLVRSRDRAASSESISPANDHPTSAISPSERSSSNSTPICGFNDAEREDRSQLAAAQASPVNLNSAASQRSRSNTREGRYSISSLSQSQQQQQYQSINQPQQPSPQSSSTSSHEPPSHMQPSSSHQQPRKQQQRNDEPTAGNQEEPLVNALEDIDLARTRLSYDIISVREPLARVLAERQRQQQQLQSRHPTSDHDYIEVYNERGSSCFYEEIAGSTTSTTYDQIDGASNHNYQALANAYAIINRANSQGQPGRPAERVELSNERNDDDNYDLVNEPDHNGTLPTYAQPSTSRNMPLMMPNNTNQDYQANETRNDPDVTPSQFVPIYSVINKATKASNIRANPGGPPKPPPKNLNHQKHTLLSTSGASIPFYEEPRVTSDRFHGQQSTDVAATHNSNVRGEGGSSSPRPPPRPATTTTRYHQNIFNATHRPLPPTESDDNSGNNNCNSANYCNPKRTDCDLKPDDNGYEFLRPNFYDDRIDVGYEKIKDSDQQFCPRPPSDNDGYESLQPIYALPVERNYETADEQVNEVGELPPTSTGQLTPTTRVNERASEQ